MESLQELFSLRGHVGLVTGASSGLGVECAKALAIGGANVVLAARRLERLTQVAAEIEELYGVRALPIKADITIQEELEQLVEKASSELGEVDILINNAGIAPTGRAERLKRKTWDEALAVNATAPMFLSQHVANRLIAAGRPGRIINIASLAGVLGSSIYRMISYATSKAAMINMTRQLAVEWAPYNILVNAITPGWIPTELNAEGLAKPGNKERMETRTPLKRLGEPAEMRGLVLYLAGPSASYMTGAIIPLDGGYSAW